MKRPPPTVGMTVGGGQAGGGDQVLMLVHASAPMNNKQDETFRAFVRNYDVFNGVRYNVYKSTVPQRIAKSKHGLPKVMKGIEQDHSVKKGLGKGKKRVSIASTPVEVGGTNSAQRREKKQKTQQNEDNGDVVMYYPLPLLPSTSESAQVRSSFEADGVQVEETVLHETAEEQQQQQQQSTNKQLALPPQVYATPARVLFHEQSYCTSTMVENTTILVPNTELPRRNHDKIPSSDQFSSLSLESSEEVPDSQPLVDPNTNVNLNIKEISDETESKKDSGKMDCPVSPLRGGESQLGLLTRCSPVSPINERVMRQEVEKIMSRKRASSAMIPAEIKAQKRQKVVKVCNVSPVEEEDEGPSPVSPLVEKRDENVRLGKVKDKTPVKPSLHKLCKVDVQKHAMPPTITSTPPLAESSPNKQPRLSHSSTSKPTGSNSTNHKLKPPPPAFTGSPPPPPSLLSLLIKQQTGKLLSQNSLRTYISSTHVHVLADYHILPPFSKTNSRSHRVTSVMATIYKNANPAKYYTPRYIGRGEPLPFERGFWRIDFRLWPRQDTGKGNNNNNVNVNVNNNKNTKKDDGSKGKRNEKDCTIKTMDKVDFWRKIMGYVRSGKLGDCQVKFEDEKEAEALQTITTTLQGEGASGDERMAMGDVIRVYCFGEVVAHIWLILFITSGKAIIKMNLQWFDGNGQVRVVM